MPIVAGAGSVGPGWGNGKATTALFAHEGVRIAAELVVDGGVIASSS